MYKFILVLVLSVMSTSMAKAGQVPQCFGDIGVSAEAPFILTIADVDSKTISIISNDLDKDNLLNVENMMDFEGVGIFILSVDGTQIVAPPEELANLINSKVAVTVGSIASKYNVPTKNLFLECNGKVTGHPRAGGVN